MLNSPVSGQAMKEVLVEGVQVHLDEASGGYWMERSELKTLADHHHVPLVETALTVGDTTERQGGRVCPTDGTALVEYEFGDHSGIKLDVCPACEGVWLDGGELRKVLNYLDANVDLWAEVSHQQEHDHVTLTQRVLLLLYSLTERPPLY